MLKYRVSKRMYAVSCEGIGLIEGTLAGSRRRAIQHFLPRQAPMTEWEKYKSAGYRTVVALVKIVEKVRR